MVSGNPCGVDSHNSFWKGETRCYHYYYFLSTEAKVLAKANTTVSDKTGLQILTIPAKF